MPTRTLKEVSAPYTVNLEDEAVGRDTVIIRRLYKISSPRVSHIPLNQ